MDELRLIDEFLVQERPPSAGTAQAARRRLTDEVAAADAGGRISRAATLIGSRRFRFSLVAVAAAVIVAVVAGTYHSWTRPLYQPEPLPGRDGPAADFLLAAADARDRHAKSGRLWYVRIEFGETHRVRSVQRPETSYFVQIRGARYVIAAKRRNGLGPGVDAESGNDPGQGAQVLPATEADRAAWIADGRPQAADLGLNSPEERPRGPLVQEGAELDFGIEDAVRLPSDPAELRAWLLNYATKFDRKRLRNPDLYLFTRATTLLIDHAVPDRVRIAMYRILASLEGVRLITAKDPAGRTGQAVAMRHTSREYGTTEWQLFIDRTTGQLTASQSVVVAPGEKNKNLRPGIRQHFEVVRKALWTDEPVEHLRPE